MIEIDSPVRGDTKLLCLLGHPVAHSLSPQIHNHACKHLGLNYVYIPLAVPPNALHTAIYAIRSFGIVGANVTIPYKKEVVHYCDSLSELSQKTGTVNTLHNSDGKLYGTTTDFEGFRRAIYNMDCSFEGCNVVIIGNGGTARTLATALAIEKQVSSLTIAGRNISKVELLANEIRNRTEFAVKAISLSDPLLRDTLTECTLLVNTTNVGMHPNVNETPLPSSQFNKKMKVFDVIYNPGKTRFLHEAEKAGCQIQNGLGMLLYQGLASFKIWTGIEVPENIYSIENLQKFVHA